MEKKARRKTRGVSIMRIRPTAEVRVVDFSCLYEAQGRTDNFHEIMGVDIEWTIYTRVSFLSYMTLMRRTSAVITF